MIVVWTMTEMALIHNKEHLRMFTIYLNKLTLSWMLTKEIIFQESSTNHQIFLNQHHLVEETQAMVDFNLKRWLPKLNTNNRVSISSRCLFRYYKSRFHMRSHQEIWHLLLNFNCKWTLDHHHLHTHITNILNWTNPQIKRIKNLSNQIQL